MTALADIRVAQHRPRHLPRTWTARSWSGGGPRSGPPRRTGPGRSGTRRGPCGPGRCWSSPSPPRPRCGPAGSASRRRPASGVVSLLPGIWSSLHLDTAITLPVGVEAYAAYALRAWLATEPAISDRTRRFAKWSAICSFALGMAGQVAYHLMDQDRVSPGAVGHHHPRVLPAGPGPGHGDRAGPHAARATPRPQDSSDSRSAGPAAQAVRRTGPPETSPRTAGPEPRGPGPRSGPVPPARTSEPAPPRFGSTTQHRRAVGPRSPAPSRTSRRSASPAS